MQKNNGLKFWCNLKTVTMQKKPFANVIKIMIILVHTVKLILMAISEKRSTSK